MALGPHGERKIWTEGRIFFSINRGPFNVELFQKAAQESRLERIRLTKTGPWGSIAIIQNSAMITPDAVELLRSNMADPERHANLVAAAAVVPQGIEGRVFCEDIFAPVYAAAGAAFRMFETLEPAKDWIAEMIEIAEKSQASENNETS